MTNITQFQNLQEHELKATLADKQYVIVDIRDANSFALGHIPGAIHLTNDNIADFIREADLDAPTVVCCYHGVSSQPAAEFLVSQDFSDVYSLDGGFVHWQSTHPEIIEK